MEQCANTMSLNRHLDDEEQREKALESLIQDLEVDLKEMEKLAYEMNQTAKDYYGYDFTEDIQELINDTLL